MTWEQYLTRFIDLLSVRVNKKDFPNDAIIIECMRR